MNGGGSGGCILGRGCGRELFSWRKGWFLVRGASGLGELRSSFVGACGVTVEFDSSYHTPDFMFQLHVIQLSDQYLPFLLTDSVAEDSKPSSPGVSNLTS